MSIELDSWMILLDDETPINKIAIPGSHDAATAGVMWMAETQSYTIEEQLQCGARYFDLRVHKKDGQYKIFHSVIDGTDFIPILKTLSDFIESHPSEFLILDFQHFKGDSEEGVKALLKEYLYDKGLMVENTSGFSNLDYIRNLKLKDVRGKALICWGNRAQESSITFLRNDNECTCGYLALDSYYIADMHKKGAEELIEKAHPIYFERVRKLKEEEKNGLFVLQCQFTDKYFVRGPWFHEKRKGSKMSEYVLSLKEHEQLEDINIIMRDFLEPKKCTEIINLNYYKGISASIIL